MDYDMVLGLERGKEKEKEFHSKKKLFSHPFSSSRFHPVSLGTSFHQAPHNRICLLLFSFDISLCRGLYKKSYCRSNSINWRDWRNWRDKSLWTKQSKWSSRVTMASRVKAGCFGMFPAVGEMCTTSVRTCRRRGENKRNKQNPPPKNVPSERNSTEALPR